MCVLCVNTSMLTPRTNPYLGVGCHTVQVKRAHRGVQCMYSLPAACSVIAHEAHMSPCLRAYAPYKFLIIKFNFSRHV
jgi:hypothetical protein